MDDAASALFTAWPLLAGLRAAGIVNGARIPAVAVWNAAALHLHLCVTHDVSFSDAVARFEFHCVHNDLSPLVPAHEVHQGGLSLLLTRYASGSRQRGVLEDHHLLLGGLGSVCWLVRISNLVNRIHFPFDPLAFLLVLGDNTVVLGKDGHPWSWATGNHIETAAWSACRVATLWTGLLAAIIAGKGRAAAWICRHVFWPLLVPDGVHGGTIWLEHAHPHLGVLLRVPGLTADGGDIELRRVLWHPLLATQATALRNLLEATRNFQ
mmetsp:Transcript_43952/g.78987  ORF Transcript_43952/g.78987 Transcript_43952/m.78987 type:complete len:266 (+) Transcript_43952:583-1380(+)